MQLLILGLFLLIYLHDQVGLSRAIDLSPTMLLLILLGLKALLVGLYAWVCRATQKRLSHAKVVRYLRRLELASALYRISVLALFGVDLYLGLLVFVRSWIARWTGIEHPILIDELLVMLPTLAMWGAGWWLYYPIERRLRESAMMRNFDRGLPVYPIWSRRQYVVSQYRYQVALILLPLLCIIAWTEVVAAIARAKVAWMNVLPEEAVTVAGCIVIFILAPVIIRLAWDTAPLPDGELREHLLAMCKRHKVRIRELLLWRTYGGMINAAVMGLVGPMRYILITDGLLQQMPARHVEAVMAHELAHVRKRHMFWLLVSAIAMMGLVELLAVVLLAANGIGEAQIDRLLALASGEVLLTPSLPWPDGEPTVLTVEHLAGLMLIVPIAAAVWLWAFGFGWVSRRIERQADTFAVAHMVRERGGETVEEPDALAMIHALQHVAELNHIRADKHSWRHGSIAWRQRYLRGLVGEHVDRLAIDRQMRWVNVLALLTVAVTAGLHYWFG